MIPTCTICGMPLSCATLEEHLQHLLERIENKQGAWLVTLNTEMLARGVRDPSYLDLIGQADIITADGMPLVWASQKKNCAPAITERTTGVDLVEAYFALDEVPNYAIIGGVDPAVTLKKYSQSAQDACKYLFTGMVNLEDTQLDEFVEQLTTHDVKTVFIALGVPKQDKLALALRRKMPHLILTGIGGTFEILGPQGSRAPQWMQNSGLEWLYRFSKEPGRLWKRYLVQYPLGIGALIKDNLKSRNS